MATVAISDLQCGVTYALIAEGMSNGTFIGPASSDGNMTTGPCPVMTQVSMYGIAIYVARLCQVHKSLLLYGQAIREY